MAVSRHERSERIPNLRTALLYSLIFGKAAYELHPDLMRTLRREIQERARLLAEKLGTETSSDRVSQTRARELRRIAEGIISVIEKGDEV